jgi:hypothetical protein
LFIYDPLVGKWSEGKPMPTARLGLRAVAINNSSIYVIAGKPSLEKYAGGEVEIIHVPEH